MSTKISTFPAVQRPIAQQVDQHLGNGDGQLSKAELSNFKNVVDGQTTTLATEVRKLAGGQGVKVSTIPSAPPFGEALYAFAASADLGLTGNKDGFATRNEIDQAEKRKRVQVKNLVDIWGMLVDRPTPAAGSSIAKIEQLFQQTPVPVPASTLTKAFDTAAADGTVNPKEAKAIALEWAATVTDGVFQVLPEAVPVFMQRGPRNDLPYIAPPIEM